MISYDLRTGKMVKYGKSNRRLNWVVEAEVKIGDEYVTYTFRSATKCRISDPELIDFINEILNGDEEFTNSEEIILRVYLP